MKQKSDWKRITLLRKTSFKKRLKILAANKRQTGSNLMPGVAGLVMGSPLVAIDWSVITGAFPSTNPTDESITSGLPVIRQLEQTGA